MRRDKNKIDISTARGATKATGPADWQSQVGKRGAAAEKYDAATIAALASQANNIVKKMPLPKLEPKRKPVDRGIDMGVSESIAAPIREAGKIAADIFLNTISRGSYLNNRSAQQNAKREVPPQRTPTVVSQTANPSPALRAAPASRPSPKKQPPSPKSQWFYEKWFDWGS